MFLRISLFWLYLVLIVSGATTTSQATPTPTPSSIIDILSSQAQYSYFLRSLQRNGLIPTINRLKNVTLLAPINSAFTSSTKNDLDNNDLLRYIVDQRFRVGYLDDQEVIFNTLYNYSDSSSYTISVTPDLDTSEYVVDRVSAIVDPDVYAKHQRSFIQGIEKLLPYKPSLCQILLSDESTHIRGVEISYIQSLFKSLFSAKHHDFDSGKKKKGVKLPLNCEEFLGKTKSVFVPSDSYINESLSELDRTYYSALFRASNTGRFDTTKDAIYEMKKDILDLLENLLLPDLIGGRNGTTSHKNYTHTSVSQKVRYSVSLDRSSNKIVLNDKISSNNNLVLANGILHVFDSQHNTNFFQDLEIPKVDIIPRKALLALHYSNFAKELKFRKLSYLIDGTTTNQTIFLDMDQRDDSEEVATTWNHLQALDEAEDHDEELEVQELSPMFSIQGFSSKQSLLYQFADEAIDSDIILKDRDTSYRLLDSKMCSKKRVGGCFQLKVSASKVNDKSELTLNDDVDIISRVHAGNDTFIYIGDREIATPSSLKHSLGDLISNGAVQRHIEHIDIDKESCLKTLGYLNEYDLFSLDDNGAGYSLFLPCGAAATAHATKTDDIDVAPDLGLAIPDSEGNLVSGLRKSSSIGDKGSWNQLGLALNYLESNPKLFKNILKGMVVKGTVYSDFGLYENTKQIFHTKSLKGDAVTFENLFFDGNYDHIIGLNNTKLPIPLNSDILFNQGVVHVINKVLLPEDFQIPFPDLIETTLDTDFPDNSILDLIKVFPKLSSALGLESSGKESSLQYSLLIPSPESLKEFNITSDFTKLFDFLEFHLIPNSEAINILECIDSGFLHQSPKSSDEKFTVKTNLSNTELTCYRNKKNNAFLKLESADSKEVGPLSYNKDHEVKILSHGCTSFNIKGNVTSGACVFLIEKPLSVDWLKGPGNFLHIHLGFVGVGVGIILGLIIFGGVMVGAILCLGNSKNKLNKKVTPIAEFSFPGNEPSFMRVLTPDDSYVIDRGYETDVDVLRTEADQLLPLYGAKKYRKRGYGSIPTYGNPATSPPPKKGVVSAPRSIRGNQISKGLNRDRNIPGYENF